MKEEPDKCPLCGKELQPISNGLNACFCNWGGVQPTVNKILRTASISANLKSTLLIVACNETQLDVFLKNSGIPKCLVKRIYTLRGIPHLKDWRQPVILLPGWRENYEMRKDVDYWLCERFGKVLEISEDVVLGKSSICPNDSNGDGDCHLCVQQGGCRWPFHPYPFSMVPK